MKASILLATYNKDDCLPNTLYSISKQETTFPFETVIVDDVSLIDPEPTVRKFLPDAEYLRLEKHVGTQFSQSRCFDFISPDSTVVVIQSCDVMYVDSKALDTICKLVVPGEFVLPEVKNVSVLPTMFESFDESISALMESYEAVEGSDIYQGINRPKGDWLMFLGAVGKDDAMKIDFHNRCCDIAVQRRIMEVGFKPLFVNEVKAVHQKHSPADRWPCSIVDSCEYWCARKIY